MGENVWMMLFGMLKGGEFRSNLKCCFVGYYVSLKCTSFSAMIFGTILYLTAMILFIWFIL